MYKLMLVDDEDVVRHQVINKIDWASYGFEIVCEAENGSEALELFELHQPDVVITDIKMPFMDGLELSEKIMEKYPYTKIIILTGFDDFEYAKKGINIHITQYVLKPVSSKELIKILQEVRVMIDEEIEHKQDVDRLRRHYEQSYDLIRNEFLDSLVNGRTEMEDIEDSLAYYNVKLWGNCYVASVVQVDKTYGRSREAVEAMSFDRVALLDVIKEMDERYNLGECFLSGEEVIILSSGDCKDPRQFISEHMERLELVRQSAKRFLNFTVTIGCGHGVSAVDALPRSRQGALSACDYKLSVGTDQVIYIGDLERSDHTSVKIDDNQIRSVKRLLKTNAQDAYEGFLEELFEGMIEMEEQKRLLVILDLFSLISATAKEMSLSSEELEMDQESIFRLLGKETDIAYKKDRFLRLGLDIMKCSESSRRHTNSTLVHDAIKYVEENYKDWELNIDKISAHLHYSPNYFSSMFKKESGKPFMNHLMEVRIDHAKDLLQSTTMKNFEIAIEVGFSSANYFSYCFKKEVGQSPTVFRKENT